MNCNFLQFFAISPQDFALACTTIGLDAIYENVCQRYISFRYAIHSDSIGSFIVDFSLSHAARGLALPATLPRSLSMASNHELGCVIHARACWRVHGTQPNASLPSLLLHTLSSGIVAAEDASTIFSRRPPGLLAFLPLSCLVPPRELRNSFG